jgi:hypothetical protein
MPRINTVAEVAELDPQEENQIIEQFFSDTLAHLNFLMVLYFPP